MSEILTLNDATKSEYGEDMYDFREVINHPLRWEEVNLALIDSTLNLSEELGGKVERKFKEIKKKNPNFFDAPKLRFEGVGWGNGILTVYLSTGITYSQHNILRNEGSLSLVQFPTPMAINELQETTDGYLLFGSRNPEVSDQSGGAVVGAGFHDPIIGKKGIEFPGGIFETALKEAKEETSYQRGGKIEIREEELKNNKIVKREIIVGGQPVIYPINYGSMRAITLVRGSNTDIIMGFYTPLTVNADEVVLNPKNFEYDDFFRVRNDIKNLERILNTGNLEGAVTNKGFVNYGVPLADHPIGMVESFLRLRDKLPRVSYHQH